MSGGRSRGVAERVKWLAAEAAVIVLGVLIALAIDAWYGTLLESRAEQVYLAQLIEDLRETERQMASATEDNRTAEESTTRLLSHLRGEAWKADSIRGWLGRVQRVNNPVPVLGTAEALIATGDLRIIEDGKARVAITRYLSRSRDFWLVPLYQLEEEHRAVAAGLLHLADLAGLEPSERGRVPIRADARSHNRPPFLPNEREFGSDPRVHSLVADLAEKKIGMRGYRDSMAREAIELRRTLEPLLRGR